MDKVEFREKYDEIKDLLAKGKVQDASELVDSINWRKVHNVNALVKASEVCAEVGRLEDAKELLYMAHERSPIGRMIIYHLALLCVQMGDLDEAKDFYDQFVEIAPHDSLKYIMKYKISKAKGADNTTLIAILEELKQHDFLEEWAYELAYLYHKTMQVDKCIDLCDEIILWFGDGPYVERALEMKMIYQPLDKMQEDKYRHFQNKRDGITEIQANEVLNSGEIVQQTIAIPQVQVTPERFNTVNLQAEIKKNIDEIMRATEEEAVSENMENIKSLVEEIPYLQVNPQDETMALEQQANKELDASIRDTFQEYLAEEYDGQMSLLVPESKEVESQVDGQMTIEDVMAEWEKTKRAAEAALQEAQQQKLESAKNIALMEANQIMDRLEEAIPKLDAGATPTDLLKEEYLAKEDTPEKDVQVEVKEENSAGFTIPKIVPEGAVAGVGLEIPVVDVADEHILKDKEPEAPALTKAEEQKDTQEWEPPVLEQQIQTKEENIQEDLPEQEEVSDVNLEEASKIVEDVNNMLQKEIDRILQSEDAQEVQMEPSLVEVSQELDASEQAEEKAEEAEAQEVLVAEEPIVAETETESEEPVAEELEEESLADKILAETVRKEMAVEQSGEPQETIEPELPEIEEVVLEPEEMAELVDEKVLEEAIKEEIPVMQLTEDEKEIFSYFMPIGGMESTICQALTGARYRIENKTNSVTGNIIIQGGPGSGKTMLASNLIKVLQNETEKIAGNVGKIDAQQLNIKDVDVVLSKVEDGCLIVERAGDLSEKTIRSMRDYLKKDNCQVLVILEGEKNRIDKMLSRNAEFAAMFTEKISIPIFTIDELVNFGKVYALEEGYAVDDMGVLAMYNRINLIQRLDHPTSLTEVRDIMEEAIDRAEKGGIKAALGRLRSKRYDEEGNLILREQDFNV
ncbi:MAG: hypothetical protein SO172_01480 [Pararoseburia sp.]|nr:hypothetical protein [Lachnospiraceae bacterium]MDY4792828.1 hypothetical protein [Pararoseburia sp.]